MYIVNVYGLYWSGDSWTDYNNAAFYPGQNELPHEIDGSCLWYNGYNDAGYRREDGTIIARVEMA